MSAVSIIGPKFRAWDPSDGTPLAGGKVYTYAAGTSTPKATYSTEAGDVENANPVILNASGYASIKLNGSYKIVVKDANDAEVWTEDPVSDASQLGLEWINQRDATQTSATSFTIEGNHTAEYIAGRRIKVADSSMLYGSIDSSSYGGGVTAVVVTVDEGVALTASLSDVFVSLFTGIGRSSGGDITVATVVAMKLLSPSPGTKIHTTDYRSTHRGGGSPYLVKTAAQATADGDVTDGYGNHSLGNGHVAVLQHKGEVNTAQFGAYADGTNTAITTLSIQACLDFAASNGVGVTDVGGVSSVSTIKVTNGIRYVDFTKGKLLPDGSTSAANLTTEGVVVLGGVLTGEATPVDSAKLSFNIDMQNGDRTAILGDGTDKCEITNCDIYGFTNDATYNHRGIRLQEGASHNFVHNNRIEGYDTPAQKGLLIDIWAEVAGLPAFGGFFTGTISRATTPAVSNIVSDNTLINGSYGINIQGVEYSEFCGNVIKGQNHRSIYLANSAYRNLISNNQLVDFRSSAVLLSYGSSENTIIGNSCKNETTVGVNGEAAINLITGSPNNTIINNDIDAPTNYGVYVATDSSFNTIKNNTIQNHYVAGIAIENDWIDTLPAGATYSRSNYADPTDLDPTYSSWTFNDLEGTVIENNTIRHGYTGRNTCGIYVAQIENDFAGATQTKVNNTRIVGNSIPTMDNIGECIVNYEHTAGELTNTIFKDNTFHESTIAADFRAATPSTPSGGVDFKAIGITYSKGNRLLDNLVRYEPAVFTAGDTTPDVSAWEFFQCLNTAPTSITDFDNPLFDHEILIRLDANTTIVYNSGVIKTKGSVNIVGTSTNQLVAFKFIKGTWFEMYRNW